MSSGRRNARNLAINWLSFGSTGIVMLLLSPFVVRSLGPVEYGIWSLLNVLTGYMGILDLGIRASTGRHIMLYIGREDHNAVDETVRTSLGFFSLLGFFILSIAALLGWGFPRVFTSVPDEFRPLLGWLVPLMAVNVWTSAVAAVFSSVLLAYERFDLARGIDLSSLAIRTIGTVIVLKLGYGIVGLAFVAVGCNLLPLLSNYWIASRVYTKLRTWPLLLNRQRLKELAGYGIAAFISSAAIKIIGQTDLVIVGGAIDVAAVTVYSVGAMLVYYSTNLIGQIGLTLWPSLQKTVARGEMGSARWIFLRLVRLSCLVGIPMYVGFIAYSEPFIRLWMHAPGFEMDSVKAAAMVMSILAASKLLNLFYIGFDPLLAAMGHVRFNASFSVAEATANLVLSLAFVLFFDLGLWGVALGTLVSRLIVMTFWVPWYACRKAGIDWPNYLIQIGGRGLLAVFIFATWCHAAQILIPCQTWLSFACSVCLSLLGFVPVAMFILVPNSDRGRISNRLRVMFANCGQV